VRTALVMARATPSPVTRVVPKMPDRVRHFTRLATLIPERVVRGPFGRVNR